MDKDFFLIRKMKSGDEEAMECFVQQYYPVILKYCRYHVEDREYAKDITQETFERFFGRLPEMVRYDHTVFKFPIQKFCQFTFGNLIH